MNRAVIDVDDAGLDENGGFDATMTADDGVIRSGMFERIPVTFRYPDGRLVDTEAVRLTTKGVALFCGLRVVN